LGLGAAAAVAGIAALGGISAAIGALPGAGSAPSGEPATPSLTTDTTPLPAVGEPSPRPPEATAVASPSAAATPRPTPAVTPVPTAPPPQSVTYVVQPGDTLAAIAVRFGTSVSALQAANDLADTDVILIGQVLVIP
jgi:LysM repeat protein